MYLLSSYFTEGNNSKYIRFIFAKGAVARYSLTFCKNYMTIAISVLNKFQETLANQWIRPIVVCLEIQKSVRGCVIKIMMAK